MKTIANNSYRFTSLVLLVGALALSGCTPVYMAAPQPQPIPQARPLPRPPVQQQPRYVDVPPVLAPAQEQQQVVPYRPVVPVQRPQDRVSPPRKSSSPRKSSPVRKPSVSYIPDQPKTAPVQTAPSAPAAKTEPETRPFWDQGKVEVEILDMKKPSASISGSEQTSGGGQDSTTASTSGSSGITGSSSSPAVVVLMKQANNELVAGKADRAAATLERALRISPDDASLWLRLAEVNAQQGNKSQAASMAKKAMTLAPGDANIVRRSQRLLN